MSTIKIRGIIIKESPVGESDKYLTIFTKDRGKLIIRARGAKNSKSKYLTAQLFAYCDFVIYSGKNFYSLTQIELLESFYNLRLNYDSLMIAYNIISMVDNYFTGSIDNEESSDILLLILKSLKRLTKKGIDQNLIQSVFTIKFLQIVGLAPTLDYQYVYGLDQPIKINTDIFLTLNYILNSDVHNVYSFYTSSKVQKALENLCKLFLPKLELI